MTKKTVHTQQAKRKTGPANSLDVAKREGRVLRRLLPVSLLLASSWTMAVSAAAADVKADSFAETASKTADEAVWPWTDGRPALPVEGFDLEPRAVFRDMNVQPIPVKLVNGTMMAPGRALLESYGFRLAEGESRPGELRAVRPSGGTWTLHAGEATLDTGDGKMIALPEPPYLEAGSLWIPLRAPSEAHGLKVSWTEENRTATVQDPNAPLRFTVATRADYGNVQLSERLAAYMKTEWKADPSLILIPPENYTPKAHTMIAAGAPADLMLLAQPYLLGEELFISVASDLTDLLGRFPRLKALAEGESPSVRTIGGRIYGIPRLGNVHDAPFPALRQDWLDKLGLKTPETMDELYQTLVRFVKYDPDGDGRDNTIGLSGTVSDYDLGTLQWVEQSFTGSPDRFVVENGRVIDTVAGSGEWKALQWLANAYKDGLIDKEFAIISKEQLNGRLSQGRTGMAAMRPEEAAKLTTDGSAAAGQLQEWTPLPALQREGSTERFAPWSKEGAGLYIIPRTVSSDKAVRLLEWLDRGLEQSRSGQWSSVPGVTEDDLVVADSVFGKESAIGGSGSFEKLRPQVRSVYEKVIASWDKVSYAGSLSSTVSAASAQGEYTEMNRKLNQVKIKAIMGGITLEQWNAYIAEMQASEPYKAMMAQLNAAAR
ncbi:stalk domain-containing protein [Paenibacillus hodogayensis]|uniref:Stalk domain-containing protein n=1 Tax=Paenibacillus hodogayensis TaxID=279208 RepID=A0ABV5VV79_9BACL